MRGCVCLRALISACSVRRNLTGVSERPLLACQIQNISHTHGMHRPAKAHITRGCVCLCALVSAWQFKK